jgi:phenylacetate-CoA ligase
MLYRHEIYKNYLIQKKIRKLPLEEIQKIQWTRLKKLLDYVYYSSDFYREIFKTVKLIPQDINSYKDFTKLPIINKKILKNNYKKIITKGNSIKDYTVSYTAGSTGEPFPFLLDIKREHPSTTAAYMLSKENINIDPFKKYNELMIKATPINEIKINEPIRKGILHKLKYQFISETFGIKSSEIKEDNTKAIYSIIKNNNIKGIYGYSSNIYYLAKLFKMHNFKVKLKYIILIAEGLLKQQKNLIMNVFNCPVYMDYGSSECMRMGFECKYQNGYHMDIYNYYFEYLNDNGEVCEPGENANIIVTNLNNYIFPLIRYKIGDQCIAPKDKCLCGLNYPLVNQILGRDSDIIKTPLNEEISRNDFDIFLTRLYEYINQYQIVIYKADNTINIKIVPTEKFETEISKKIKEDISKLVRYSMDIKIELVEKIPFEKYGKTKTFIVK